MGVIVSNHESNNEAAETANFHAKLASFKATNRVLEDIMNERARQDAKWGGPEHDDEHTMAEWFSFILARAACPTGYVPKHDRKIAVEMAALAIAAIESFDRKSLNS